MLEILMVGETPTISTEYPYKFDLKTTLIRVGISPTNEPILLIFNTPLLLVVGVSPTIENPFHLTL